MKKKIVAKIFDLFASLLLVGQILTPALPLLVSPSYVYAQEEQAAQEQPQDQPQDQSQDQSGQESSAASQDTSPSPDDSVASSPSPEPEVGQSPSDTSSNGSDSNTQTQPSPSPEPGQSTDQEDSGQLVVEVVENSTTGSAADDPTNTPESAASASLSTDQADYAPESTVKISGSGFSANQPLTIKVTWPDGTVRASGNRLDETDNAVADSQGNLSFEYQLTGGLSGEYKLEVLDSQGQVLQTATFTDYIDENGDYNGDGDETPPISSFLEGSATDGSSWNGPIPLVGSSSDDSGDTVDYVSLYWSYAGVFEDGEEWFLIDEIYNEAGDEPFFWNYHWTPGEEGTFNIKAEATDTAGNTESSPVIYYVTFEEDIPYQTIIFNELAWAGSTTSTADEWIELKNTSESFWVDFVSGPFSIFDFATDSTMLTVDSGLLGPGGLFLVANSAQDFLYSGGESVLAVDSDFISSAVSLSNTNLHLGLYDIFGNLVDEAGGSPPFAGYSDSNPNHKYSMARKDGAEDGTDPDSWFTSVNAENIDEDKTDTNRGTPKAENTTVNSVTFRWQGVNYDDELPGNFEGTLFDDDRIQLNYGDGNQEIYPGVGLHEPGPETTLYSAHHGSGDLNFALSSLWTSDDGSYLPEELIANAFMGGGVAQDFHADDDSFLYGLPFPFSFFGVSGYETVCVSTNGFLAFDTDDCSDYWDQDFGESNYPLIAPFSIDFVTDWDEGDDIYITDSPIDGTPPRVSEIVLSDPSPTGPGLLTMDVNFNENMDTHVEPDVSFGEEEPFTQHATSSEWIDPDTWRATVTIPDADDGGEDWDGINTIRVAGAVDVSGNEMDEDTRFTFEIDTKDPVSTFTSPDDGAFFGEGGILVEGFSEDESEDGCDGGCFTVEIVNVYARVSGTEDWGDPVLTFENQDENEQFYWDAYWTPEEGTYDLKVAATDDAGNVESSDFRYNVTYDVTDPTSDITYPQEDQRYIEDVWDGEIRGTSSDSPSSGVATVLVSIQRDADGLYWDGGGWSEGRGDGEILNEDVDFDEGTGDWDFAFNFIEPEGADEGYIVRSHAVDNVGNQEDTTEVHFFFSHGLPIISGEGTVNVGSAQVTFVWTTDNPATSRVVYDTVSHPDPLGEPPNYGYANSTGESDTDPKVTSHTVVVCCFDQSTSYFYRVVSQGSPEAASGEKSFTTPATPPQSINPNSQGPGITTPTGPGPSGPSAPTAAGAVAGAVTQLAQVLGFGTGGEILAEATSEATPAASPSPSPAVGEPQEVEEAKAFWQNWWWLILLILLSAGAFWWYSKKSK